MPNIVTVHQPLASNSRWNTIEIGDYFRQWRHKRAHVHGTHRVVTLRRRNSHAVCQCGCVSTRTAVLIHAFTEPPPTAGLLADTVQVLKGLFIDVTESVNEDGRQENACDRVTACTCTATTAPTSRFTVWLDNARALLPYAEASLVVAATVICLNHASHMSIARMCTLLVFIAFCVSVPWNWRQLYLVCVVCACA
jgi:hypothetical protein